MENVSKSKSADVSIQGDSPKDASQSVEGNCDGINSAVCVMCKLPGHDLKNCLSTIPAGKACRFCKCQKQHAVTCRVRQRLCKTCGRKGHTSKDCPMKKQSSTNVISTTAETESKADQTSSQDKNRTGLETDPQRNDKNLSVSKSKKTKQTDEPKVTRSTETTGNINRTKVTSKPSMKDHPSTDSSSSCSICGKSGHASTECFLCFGCGNVSAQCRCSSPACPTCKQTHCQCKAAESNDNEDATGVKTEEEFEISMDDLNLDMGETTAFQARKSIRIQLRDIVSNKSDGSEDAEDFAKGTSDVIDDKEEEEEVAEIQTVVEGKTIDIISLDSDEEEEGKEQSRTSNGEGAEKAGTNRQLPPMRCFKCWGVSNDSSDPPICFVCGKVGHVWSACATYNGDNVCFNCSPACSLCGKAGHADVDCPDKNKPKSSKRDTAKKKTKQCFACKQSGHQVTCCRKAPWMRGNRCIKCQSINNHCAWCCVITKAFCYNCNKSHKKKGWVRGQNCRMYKKCFQCGSSEHPWTECALIKSGAKNKTESESTPEKTNTSKVDSVTADPPVIKCYACYKTGHRRESCPEPLKSVRPAWEVCNDAKECFGCGKRGHQYTDCPTRQCRISAQCKSPVSTTKASSAAAASAKASSRVMCFTCGLGASHSTNECPLQKKNIKNAETKLRAADVFAASASDTADNESESEEGVGKGKLSDKDGAGAKQATEQENPSTTQTNKSKRIQEYDKSSKWDSRLNKCKKCYKLGHFESDCPQSEAECSYLSKIVDTTPLVKHKVTASVTTTTPSLTSAASKKPRVDVKKMVSGMCKICHCKGHEPEYCPLNDALALCKRVEEKGKEVNKREEEKEKKIKALEKQRLAKMIKMQENELRAEREKKEIEKGQRLLEEEMKERNNTSEKEKKSDSTINTSLGGKPEQKSGKAKAKATRRSKHSNSRKSTQRQSITGPPIDGPPMGGPQMHEPNMGRPQMQGPNVGGPQMLGPNIGGPQIQGPNMGGPQMPRPNMGGPHMGAPQMQGPNMGGPQMQGPNMGGPQMQGPNIGAPQMQGPNMGGPQMQGPNMCGPQMQGHNMYGPQMQGPNMGGPQMHRPNMGGPQMQGPNMGGPQMHGLHMGGPQMQGPYMGGPRMQEANMGGPQMQGPNMGRPQMQTPHMGGPMQRQPFGMPPLQGPHMGRPPYQGTPIPMGGPPFPGPPRGQFMGPQSSPNMQFVPRGPPGPGVPFLRGPSPVQPPQFGFNQPGPMPVGPPQGKPSKLPSKIFDDPNDPMKAATELMRKFLESSDSSSDSNISSRSRSRSQSPTRASKSSRSLSRSRSRMNIHKARRHSRSRSRERGLKARHGRSPGRDRRSPNSRRRSRSGSPVYPSYFGPDHGYRDLRTHEEYYGPPGSMRESFYPHPEAPPFPEPPMDSYPPGPDMGPGPPHPGEDPRVRLLNYFQQSAANIQHDLQLDAHHPRPPYEHYPEDIPSTSWSHESHGGNCICKECRSPHWEKRVQGASKVDAYSGRKRSRSRERRKNEHIKREHSRSREKRKNANSGRESSRSRERRINEQINEQIKRERSRSREKRMNKYSGKERSRSREKRIKNHTDTYRKRSRSNDRNISRTRESEKSSEVKQNRTDWSKNDDTERFRDNSRERYHNQSRDREKYRSKDEDRPKDWDKSGYNDRPNTRNSSRERERSTGKDASSSTEKSASNKGEEKSGTHEKPREKFTERDRSLERDRKKPRDSRRDRNKDMSQGRYHDGKKESSTDLQKEKLKEGDASRNKSRQESEERSRSDNSGHSKMIDGNGNSLVKSYRERERNASLDKEIQKRKSDSGDDSSNGAKVDLQNVSTHLVSDLDRSEIGSSVLNSENPFNTTPVNVHDSNSLDSFETRVVQNELVESHRIEPRSTQVDVKMNQTRCEGESVNEEIQQSMGDRRLDTSTNEISYDSIPHGEVIVDILGDDNEIVSKPDAIADSQNIERTEETTAPATSRGRGQSCRGRGRGRGSGRGAARSKATRGRARLSEGVEFDSGAAATGSRTLRSRTRAKRGCSATTRTGDQEGE